MISTTYDRRWRERAGPGPWDHEPDKIQWSDDATGLPCLIVRGPLGALCGYVGVPEGHPWYGVEFSAVNAEVHGGLTYSSPCQHGGKICHVPEPGEPDNVWWLGFDCAHLGDLTPGAYLDDGTYRDVGYVTRETAHLAQQAQLAALEDE